MDLINKLTEDFGYDTPFNYGNIKCKDLSSGQIKRGVHRLCMEKKLIKVKQQKTKALYGFRPIDYYDSPDEEFVITRIY